MSDPAESNLEQEVLKFNVARAEAISKYSDLEQALCECFAYFSGTTRKVAGTIFFKISNARARRDILDDLKRQKIAVKYSRFWDSILKTAATLDDERNRVVHWTTAFYLYFSEEPYKAAKVTKPILKKPNFFAHETETPEITTADLEAFERRCEVLRGAFEGFLVALRADLEDEEGRTWREICQRPLDDPLPPDHPLHRRPIGFLPRRPS